MESINWSNLENKSNSINNKIILKKNKLNAEKIVII